MAFYKKALPTKDTFAGCDSTGSWWLSKFYKSAIIDKPLLYGSVINPHKRGVIDINSPPALTRLSVFMTSSEASKRQKG
jgi:hypothetical protein